MSEFASKSCVPCRGGVPPLKGIDISQFHKHITRWDVVQEHHLSRIYRFPDFRTALNFVLRVGDMAEEQGHHPDIDLSWGKVQITIWTHKIDGLTESDFIFAAKCDALPR